MDEALKSPGGKSEVSRVRDQVEEVKRVLDEFKERYRERLATGSGVVEQIADDLREAGSELERLGEESTTESAAAATKILGRVLASLENVVRKAAELDAQYGVQKRLTAAVTSAVSSATAALTATLERVDDARRTARGAVQGGREAIAAAQDDVVALAGSITRASAASASAALDVLADRTDAAFPDDKGSRVSEALRHAAAGLRTSLDQWAELPARDVPARAVDDALVAARTAARGAADLLASATPDGARDAVAEAQRVSNEALATASDALRRSRDAARATVSAGLATLSAAAQVTESAVVETAARFDAEHDIVGAVLRADREWHASERAKVAWERGLEIVHEVDDVACGGHGWERGRKVAHCVDRTFTCGTAGYVFGVTVGLATVLLNYSAELFDRCESRTQQLRIVRDERQAAAAGGASAAHVDADEPVSYADAVSHVPAKAAEREELQHLHATPPTHHRDAGAATARKRHQKGQQQQQRPHHRDHDDRVAAKVAAAHSADDDAAADDIPETRVD